MAYADAIRIDSPTVEQIATLIEGQLVSASVATASSTISTTSTTGADTDISLAMTCPSGSKVVVGGWISLSAAAAGYVEASVSQNGTDLTPFVQAWDSVTSTVGAILSVPVGNVFTPSIVGTNTYILRFRIPLGGTVYSAKRLLWAAVVRV